MRRLRATRCHDHIAGSGPLRVNVADRKTLDGATTTRVLRVDAGATVGALQLRGAAAEIGLRVRNVFDASYAEIYNFPTEGRVLQLTARLMVSR